jgi:hypothetical protein
VNVTEARYLSVCDGLLIWANDSRNAYHFPTVSDGEAYFEDSIYMSVDNIRTTVVAEKPRYS